jgi:hypothetical protein
MGWVDAQGVKVLADELMTTEAVVSPVPPVRAVALRAVGVALLLLAGWGAVRMGARSSVTAPRTFIVLYVGLFVAVVLGALLLFGPWARRQSTSERRE